MTARSVEDIEPAEQGVPPAEIVAVIRALIEVAEGSWSAGEVCQLGEWMIAKLEGRDYDAGRIEREVEAAHAEHFAKVLREPENIAAILKRHQPPDCSDIPEVSAEWFSRAKLEEPK